MIRRSNRPRHREALYFPHRRLWTTKYSCKAQAPAQDHGGPSIMERFKRMTPPSFKGESYPLMAESWLRETEKIFLAIRCPDEDKVTLATYMLQPALRTRLVAIDHCTLDEALSAACRQEGEMEQYLEEKKASQKRPAATFQRQDKKKTVYQTPQKPVTVNNSQMLEVWEERPQDQGLPKTPARSSAWSASTSSSGSRASYRKTWKASSPSSS
ncbi:hypothetical protein Taro_052977, partial [Colocasia esculenta]|nr:hypothetical protein [Colocasia esculenta]